MKTSGCLRDERPPTTDPMYIHLRNFVNDMKQEKLCESEDMTERDYSRWYADPVEEQKFIEELGAANTARMWEELEAKTRHVNDERAEIGRSHV